MFPTLKKRAFSHNLHYATRIHLGVVVSVAHLRPPLREAKLVGNAPKKNAKQPEIKE